MLAIISLIFDFKKAILDFTIKLKLCFFKPT